MYDAHTGVARVSCVALLLIGFGLPARADVPLASREADRQAKFAVPAADAALLYVFRPEQPAAPPLAVTLNDRETVRLAPRTFMMWRVKPGRAALAAEGTGTLAFKADGGRVYYVELSRSPAGVTMLRQVPFPTGRTRIQRARLVAQTDAASPPPRERAAPAPVRQPGNFALALKLGSFELAEESQNIVGTLRRFDSSASSVFALEGEYFVRPDISFGLEAVSYANDFSTPSNPAGTGSADTTAVLFNAKRYFLPASAWQPYLGVGAGAASIDFSGAITGSTGGLALQLVGGVQWRLQRLAVRAEYKYLNVDTEDDNNQKVDGSGSGFFLGAGFYF